MGGDAKKKGEAKETGGVGARGSKVRSKPVEAGEGSEDFLTGDTYQVVELPEGGPSGSNFRKDDLKEEKLGFPGPQKKGIEVYGADYHSQKSKRVRRRGRKQLNHAPSALQSKDEDECVDESSFEQDASPDEHDLPTDDLPYLTFEYVGKCWDAVHSADSDCKCISAKKFAMFIAKELSKVGPKVFAGMATDEKFNELHDLLKEKKNEFWGGTSSKALENDPEYMEAASKFVSKNPTARKPEQLFQQTVNKCFLPYFQHKCLKPVTAALIKKLYDAADDAKVKVWGKFPEALAKLAHPVLEKPGWHRILRLPDECQSLGYCFGTVNIPAHVVEEIERSVKLKVPDVAGKPENDPNHCLQQLNLATSSLKSSKIRTTALELELTVWKEREKQAKKDQDRWKNHLERALEIQKLGEKQYEDKLKGICNPDIVIDKLKETAKTDIVQATLQLASMTDPEPGTSRDGDGMAAREKQEILVCQKFMAYYAQRFGIQGVVELSAEGLPIAMSLAPSLQNVVPQILANILNIGASLSTNTIEKAAVDSDIPAKPGNDAGANDLHVNVANTSATEEQFSCVNTSVGQPERDSTLNEEAISKPRDARDVDKNKKDEVSENSENKPVSRKRSRRPSTSRSRSTEQRSSKSRRRSKTRSRTSNRKSSKDRRRSMSKSRSKDRRRSSDRRRSKSRTGSGNSRDRHRSKSRRHSKRTHSSRSPRDIPSRRDRQRSPTRSRSQSIVNRRSRSASEPKMDSPEKSNRRSDSGSSSESA